MRGRPEIVACEGEFRENDEVWRGTAAGERLEEGCCAGEVLWDAGQGRGGLEQEEAHAGRTEAVEEAGERGEAGGEGCSLVRSGHSGGEISSGDANWSVRARSSQKSPAPQRATGIISAAEEGCNKF